MVKRFTTFVIATSPTFWLKEVIGIHPKTEDSALMNPSQAIDPEISFCSAFLPRAVAASAEVSPIVSVADTRKINVTETIALRLNSGVNGIRDGNAMTEVSFSAEKSTIPIKIAKI